MMIEDSEFWGQQTDPKCKSRVGLGKGGGVVLQILPVGNKEWGGYTFSQL